MRAQSSPPTRFAQRGGTLLELGLALVAASVILGGAFQVWRSLSGGVDLLADVRRLETRVEALRYAVVDWYRGQYCTATDAVHALPIYVDESTAELVCSVDPDNCMALHLAPALRSLVDNSQSVDGILGWRVASPPTSEGASPPPPRLYVAWTPPAGLGHRTEAIAQQLDAFCDDDGDFDVAETCDGQPVGEQVVMMSSLRANEALDNRLLRLTEWLARYAVDCDADRDGVLDLFCDGPDGDGLIGDAGYVLDVDGDGCDDAHPRPPTPACQASVPIDRDRDGRLDLDATLDLAVSAADYHALGC